MQNADPNQDPTILVNGDFSSLYTAQIQGSVAVQLDFPIQDIGYIAIGGSNVAKKDSITVKYGDASNIDDNDAPGTFSEGLLAFSEDGETLAEIDYYADTYELGYTDSEVLVFKVDARTDRITLTINGSGSTSNCRHCILVSITKCQTTASSRDTRAPGQCQT